MIGACQHGLTFTWPSPDAPLAAQLKYELGSVDDVHRAAQAVTSRLRRRFSGVVDVSVRGRPGRRRRFGRQHLRRQHLRRWRRVVAAARSAAARVAARRVAAARATFRLGRLICVGQTI